MAAAHYEDYIPHIFLVNLIKTHHHLPVHGSLNGGRSSPGKGTNGTGKEWVRSRAEPPNKDQGSCVFLKMMGELTAAASSGGIQENE